MCNFVCNLHYHTVYLRKLYETPYFSLISVPKSTIILYDHLQVFSSLKNINFRIICNSRPGMPPAKRKSITIVSKGTHSVSHAKSEDRRTESKSSIISCALTISRRLRSTEKITRIPVSAKNTNPHCPKIFLCKQRFRVPFTKWFQHL